MHRGLEIRNGKECRKLWANNPDPKINRHKWTLGEDEIIIQTHAKYGNKWSEIAKMLKGRTENQVKNRYKNLDTSQISEKKRCYEAKGLMLKSVRKSSSIVSSQFTC
jgi:hypothetical protein